MAAVGLVLLGLGGWLMARQIMGRVCVTAKLDGDRKAFFTGLPRVANIAHRGASKLEAEHTLAAYEVALAQGADVLELDLRVTRDGVLVVAHDATLERTLGIDLELASASWAEVANAAGDRTPLRLDEVLRQFPRTRLNLELKDEQTGAARALIETLRAHAAESRVIVASRHHPVLLAVRALDPHVATSASTREVLAFTFCDWMGKSCPAPYSALQIPALRWLGFTSRQFVAAARARNIAVHFWTIDDPSEQRQLIDIGADGIMTNEPGTLRETLAASLPVLSQP